MCETLYSLNKNSIGGGGCEREARGTGSDFKPDSQTLTQVKVSERENDSDSGEGLEPAT